jgi:2-hydroxychromene-2-carboxylate isomerase
MKDYELEFWFDFASTYSYVSAMRIGEWVKDAGVKVRWMPFLLGPHFKEQGWETSPFNVYPAKGRYMWTDVKRLCDRKGLAFVQPVPFPQSSLLATRVAVAARNEEWMSEFCKQVFIREFAQAQDISSKEALLGVLDRLTDDPADWLARANLDKIKSDLRTRVGEARGKGIFGAPTFITSDNEMFWGDDRLEQSIEWILKRR